MGEMGGWAKLKKHRLKCEIWEKWGATYGRNGWVGARNTSEDDGGGGQPAAQPGAPDRRLHEVRPPNEFELPGGGVGEG